MTGAFAVQGRVPQKIAKLQIQAANNIPKFLKTKIFRDSFTLGLLHKNQEFFVILEHMLCVNPKNRMSPEALLKNDFLRL